MRQNCDFRRCCQLGRRQGFLKRNGDGLCEQGKNTSRAACHKFAANFVTHFLETKQIQSAFTERAASALVPGAAPFGAAAAQATNATAQTTR